MEQGNQNIFVTIHSSGSVVNARLHGPTVGDREGEIILAELTNHLAEHPGSKHVVLDFEDVSFLNSAGIGACLKMRSTVIAVNATTILYRLRSEIADVLRITHLDRVFSIAKDEKHLAKLTR